MREHSPHHYQDNKKEKYKAKGAQKKGADGHIGLHQWVDETAASPRRRVKTLQALACPRILLLFSHVLLKFDSRTQLRFVFVFVFFFKPFTLIFYDKICRSPHWLAEPTGHIRN